MDNTYWLQIFLAINIFLMGIIVSVATRHALAHFKPHAHDGEKTHAVHTPTFQLSSEQKTKLLEKAEVQFQKILNHSTEELSNSLATTTSSLNKQLEKIGNEVITSEMKRYHDTLEKLRTETESSIGGAKDEISKHQQELIARLNEKQIKLEEQLAEKIKTEQQILIQNIDNKLADAVASFLNETLKHNIDLGAQSSYLIDLLEEHKTELKKGLNDEV